MHDREHPGAGASTTTDPSASPGRRIMTQRLTSALAGTGVAAPELPLENQYDCLWVPLDSAADDPDAQTSGAETPGAQMSGEPTSGAADAAPEQAGAGASESGWVVRARRYHAGHADQVAAFAQATNGACDSGGGEPDPQAIARWQASHGVPPDGRIGADTVAAASQAPSSTNGSPAAAPSPQAAPSPRPQAAAPPHAAPAPQPQAAPQAPAAQAAPAAPLAAPAAPAKPDPQRTTLLEQKRDSLFAMFSRGVLDAAQVVQKLVTYDRRLGEGQASAGGIALLPMLLVDMVQHVVDQVSAAPAADAAPATATPAAAPPAPAAPAEAAEAEADADAAASVPPLPSSTTVLDLAEYYLTLLLGDDTADAGGAQRIAAQAQTEAAVPEVAPAQPKKDKPQRTNGASGGPKKTSGAEDLVETYGTVDEIKKNKLTEDIPTYYVDGLALDAKKHKTTDEKDGVDDLKMISKTTPVHTKVAGLFREIFAEILSSGDWKNILEQPWAYNPRQNRNNTAEWSIHSWGTAIDVNATTNPNGGPGPTERQKKIAPHFTSRGFSWLAGSDAMHFQLHTGGAPKITNEEIEQIKAGKHSGTSAKELARDVKGNLKKLRAKLVLEMKKKESEDKRQVKKPRNRVAATEARIAHLEEMLALLAADGSGGGGATGEG